MIAPKPENSVFLNCPFDPSYKRIFEAIVFAIFDAGFIPRCALEADDSTENRLAKIFKLISECNYGIHDISYTETDSATKLPRFNMPFELGLYFSCQRFGGRLHARKKSVILDREPYRYRDSLSDIAGQDIHAHHGDPRAAVKEVRDWLRAKSGIRNIPGGAEIWQRYERFRIELPQMCEKERILVEELTFADFSNFVALWLEQSR